MTTISEDRVDRAALAIAFKQYGCNPTCVTLNIDGKCACVKQARAALEADAPAILATKIEALKEIRNIVLKGSDIANAIDARIASLKAEMKEGGK